MAELTTVENLSPAITLKSQLSGDPNTTEHVWHLNEWAGLAYKILKKCLKLFSSKM